MAQFVGTALILGSWLYIFVAIKYADRTYKELAKIDPSYFSEPTKLTKSLNWQASTGVMKFIGDRTIGQRDYPTMLLKRIENAKALYSCAPLAFVLFLIGIWVR